MQTFRKIEMKIHAQHLNDFNLLDKWLKSALKIDITQDINAPSHIESLLQRNLLLINYLFQLISVPCFDKGSILNIKQDPKISSMLNIEMAIVNIDNIPNICYDLIINFATKAIMWMMQKPINESNREHLYGSIQTEVLNKLKRLIKSGKSTIPILRIAHQKNIPFIHLGGSVYQLGWGINSRKIDRSITDFDSQIGAKLSEDKIITSNFIRRAGLPAPVNGLAFNVKDAILISHKIGWSVVVKPVDGNRGEGVSIGVSNDQQVETAFEVAKKFSRSKQILVEREVKGVAHRIFIVNGKFLYTIKRHPKSIEGDGKNNVKELIDSENKLRRDVPPWARTEKFPDDDKAIEAMGLLGFSLNSIPASGEFIPLRMIQSSADGGSPEDLTDCIHPDNIEIAVRVTKLLGLNIAGVDIISPDIKKPWHENGAIINEVNFSPLLGGSEISEKYVPNYLKEIIEGDGRIKINVIFGGINAMKTALYQHKKSIKKGKACFLSSDTLTLDNSKTEIIFPFKSLYKRCRALLLNIEVEEIILVVQTDEFMHTGLPIDSISEITLVDKNIRSFKNMDKIIPSTKTDELIQRLENTRKRYSRLK